MVAVVVMVVLEVEMRSVHRVIVQCDLIWIKKQFNYRGIGFDCGSH